LWFIDPRDRAVLVVDPVGERCLRGNDDLNSPLLPGFAMAASELFAES
jgi:Uma2 family endonuclease